MRLEQNLVLNHYLHRQLDARGGFAFKYFQWLALLYTEIVLDRLTADPNAFIAELNRIPNRAGLVFEPDDLRRLAFFMATGSGKTLLLHVHLRQILHYLEHGRHPAALVRRADGRREFENILLVTPNEGLSKQHLEELERSGIEASRLSNDPRPPSLFGPEIRVIEIHKLAEVPSGDGVSIPLESLGGANLVFVDEGHKGTGSTARSWKTRQRRLSAAGLLVEYSATFAQAIAVAGRESRKRLLEEYGRSIVFDYSYRHFHDEGFGKDFRVLNLARGREERAHDLLLGALLPGG